MLINCLIDRFVKPGERLIGIGMLANIIPINILQVVNERFCIEGLSDYASIIFFWSTRGDACIILIFLQHNTVVSENCEKSKQILPATRSKMYKVDKSGNILGT